MTHQFGKTARTSDGLSLELDPRPSEEGCANMEVGAEEMALTQILHARRTKKNILHAAEGNPARGRSRRSDEEFCRCTSERRLLGGGAERLARGVKASVERIREDRATTDGAQLTCWRPPEDDRACS